MIQIELPLHFLRPWWWLALAPLPAVLWLLARGTAGRAAFARLVDAALLPHLVRDAGVHRRWALGLVALAWLVAVTALAGPAWQKVATPLYVNGAARVVALSLSNDMLAQDVQPDRMERARFAVHDLLDGAGDARTALVAYAGAAFTVAPLTRDKRTVLNLLRALSPNVMPVPGNDAAAGIRQSVSLLQHAHVKGGEIVLVTDTAGSAAITAARAAHAQGIRVDVLGIGTSAGAPVPRAGGGFASNAQGIVLARRDDAALRAVANAGGGRYAVLQADGSGTTAFTAPVAEAAQASHGEHAELWRDGGAWLLPVLLVLAALAFRRGWLLVFAVLVLPAWMPAAHAATWSSLFANRDQQALAALQHGDAQRAQQLATTPALRGAAKYRAGNFAGAAKAFAKGNDARSRYNLGNALARQGQYPQAIAAYRQALQRDPDMADAHANLKAVEDWMKRHPQTSPQGGNPQQAAQPGSQSSTGQGASADAQRGQPSAQSGANPTRAAPRASAPAGAGNESSSAESGAHAGDTHMATGGGRSSATSAAATDQQQQQQAQRGLAQELERARGHQPSAQHAFALGQSAPRPDARLNAQQRALIDSVPDDPGALLRRKFKLEWAQRHGQSQEDGGQ